MAPRRPKTLSLPVLNILLALADGAKHGYAIKQDVEERTEGAIRLGPGTLVRGDPAAGRRRPDRRGCAQVHRANGQEAQRRVYRLTERGWSVLRREVRQLGTSSIARVPTRGCARASRDGHLQAAAASLSAAVQAALSEPSSRSLSCRPPSGWPDGSRRRPQVLGLHPRRFDRDRVAPPPRSGSRRLRRRARTALPPKEVSNGHRCFRTFATRSARSRAVQASRRSRSCRSPSASAATA